jgi:hypothetical protein
MAIPIMGLKLCGYNITLLNAAITTNKTAIINVDVLCLFILNMLCAKIGNYSFSRGIL